MLPMLRRPSQARHQCTPSRSRVKRNYRRILDARHEVRGVPPRAPRGILHAMALQISGKDLGALALKSFCPRCFWISRRAKFPWQVFPGIFSSIDSFSKKLVHGAFDRGAAPGWLAPLGELRGYKAPPSAQKFRTDIEPHGLVLTGAPDAIFERTDATLVIADYKTSRHTDAQDRLLPMYRVQLNAYAYIARQLGWNPVSALALVYTEPLTSDEAAARDESLRAEGFAMGFAARIVPVALDEPMLAPLFGRAAQIHALAAPPAPREGCLDCERLETIRSLLR